MKEMIRKNIAVAGCGYWGKNLVRNFAELGALHTVCDSSRETLEQLVITYPSVKGETDFSKVLSNDEIEGVVIATPAAQHYIMATEALLAGKDVFIEKPFTSSTAEAEELLRISEKQNRVLLVGHLLLYHPALQTLKKYVDSGELGDIYYVYSTRVNLGQIRRDENALWRLVPHDISMFAYLLGGTPQVLSAGGASYLQRGFIDVVFVTLKFNNALAHVHASWLDPHKIRQLTVVGSKRMAVFDDMEPEYKLQIYDKAVAGDTLSIKSGQAVFPQCALTEPLLLECRDFIHSIAERKKPLADARMGLTVVKALEMAENLMSNGSKC